MSQCVLGLHLSRRGISQEKPLTALKIETLETMSESQVINTLLELEEWAIVFHLR